MAMADNGSRSTSDLHDFGPLETKRPKSPPLAFAKTSNDALAPLIQPYVSHPPSSHNTNSSSSPGHSPMDRLGSPGSDKLGLHVVIEQQVAAIQLLHDAFAAERRSWILERDSLHQRIAALESLLRSGNHYSPAKSPVLSPLNGGGIGCGMSSPHTRAVVAAHPSLPSIAEYDKVKPLSRRRPAAPTSIELPVPAARINHRRRSSVTFAESSPGETHVLVEEIPVPAARLSPPPLSFRREAGHTPLRPPTPPPKDSLSMDAIEDTPTRNNTHINTLLTKDDGDDDDRALKGPLNMPELPTRPTETNFTLEMLSKKLEQIEQHPDEPVSRPLVFAQRSPGLASPGVETSDFNIPTSAPDVSDEIPLAPVATRSAVPSAAQSDVTSSKAFSPTGTAALSPNGAPLSPQTSHELQIQRQFDQGGIKLKKKPSSNFGAPFGQLGGFSSVRKLS